MSSKEPFSALHSYSNICLLQHMRVFSKLDSNIFVLKLPKADTHYIYFHAKQFPKYLVFLCRLRGKNPQKQN